MHLGIVTFEWLKGKNSAPSSSWTHLVNLTHPQIRFLLASPQPASFFTGVQEDKTIVIPIGRNRGSGTRANCLLDAAYNVTTPVDQWAIKSTYQATGVLTFGTVGTFSDSDVLEVCNDG